MKKVYVEPSAKLFDIRLEEKVAKHCCKDKGPNHGNGGGIDIGEGHDWDFAS